MPIAADIYYHFSEGSDVGQRPPIILIHGAGGNHLYWPSEVRRLPGYRVYALDLPGHGKSTGRGFQSISPYVDSIVGWLAVMDMHSGIFVGHSMGSAIALSLALQHPEHVLGLGLLGAAARLRVNPELIESVASPATFYSAIEMIVQWSFSPQAPANLVELVKKRMAEVRPSVLYGDFQACDAFDMTGDLERIQQPTLILSGDADKMTPLRHSQYLANTLPKATLEVVNDAGHMLMIEHPQIVAAALARFASGILY